MFVAAIASATIEHLRKARSDYGVMSREADGRMPIQDGNEVRMNTAEPIVRDKRAVHRVIEIAWTRGVLSWPVVTPDRVRASVS